MRPLEELLLVSSLLFCLLLHIRSFCKTKGLQIKSFRLLFFICAVQIIVEEARWQMFPVYLAVLLLGSAVFSLRDRGNILRTANAAFSLGLLGILLSSLVPIARLPVPSGPYLVGTQKRELVDFARHEIFSENPEQKRTIPVQIWYPARNSLNSRTEPYMQATSDYGNLLKAALPSILASHLHLISTHSLQDAPIACSITNNKLIPKERFPLIIFSHGLMGGRIQNTIQCEELASHGYIVVGIDHPYDAAFAIYPDGRTICSQLLTGKPARANAASIQSDGFDVRVRDLIFIVNWLYKTNDSDPQKLLKDSMDLNKIGVMGHSFGGSTGLLSSAIDKRIKAAIDLDGSTVGCSASDNPVLIMHADHANEDRLRSNDYERRHHGEIVNIQITGTGHANFTDLPILTPLHGVLLLSGNINPTRCEKILNDYTLDFFDHYLKQREFRVIRKPGYSTQAPISSYPEVRYLKESSEQKKKTEQ